MPNHLKFVSLPDKLLAGIDTHHHHLLTEEFGDNFFPAETLAIGTGVFEGNTLAGIGFDFGSDENRRHAMEQIRQWCEDHGYQMDVDVFDIYKQASSIYDGNFNYLNAFWFYNGHLYVGSNHPALVAAVGWDQYDWEQPGVFGWVIGDHDGKVGAEIYSDSYHQDYSEEEIEQLLKALRERWPITEITYGPDEDTIREMEEYFDPREAALRYIDKVTNL